MSSAPEPEAAPPEGSTPPEGPVAPAAAPSKAPTSEGAKKKKLKAKTPKPPAPQTEDEIDSPSKQTLGMLAVIGIMTVCMWLFARGGCNYHPPKETRDPRKVDLVDLARDPKDAALELQQRWATKSFGGALDLARGPLVDELKQQQQLCDSNPQCAKEASSLRGKAQTVSVLLERDPFKAVARVTTYGASATPQNYIVELERDQQLWKAVSRKVDDGSFRPRPAPVPVQRPGSMILRPPEPQMSTPDDKPGNPAPASSH